MLPLTRSEYAICEYLALHAGQTFTKEQIYEAVFGIDGTANDTAVTQHIKNIRAKLRAAGELLWLLSIRAAALYALKPPRPFTPRLQNASGWLLRRSKPGRKEYDYRKLFYHLRRSPLAVPAQQGTGGGRKPLSHNGD